MRATGISIVIVTYNSQEYIERCLETQLNSANQWGGAVEFIVVDNASSDSTVALIHRQFPSVMIIQNSNNEGFAAGANRGMRASSLPWIMIINPDTHCDAPFITSLMHELPQYESCVINPLICCLDGSVNATGLTVHYTGIATCQSLGSPSHDFSKRDAFLVAAPSGAVVVAQRTVWNALKGFDEDYFLYMEDVDLGIRAHILGYACVCIPTITIYHDYRVRMTPQKFFYLERNRVLMLQKLYTPALRQKIRWGLRLTAATFYIYALMHGRAYVKSYWQARRSIRTTNPTHNAPSTQLTQCPAYMQSALSIEALKPPPLMMFALRLVNRLYDVLARHSEVLALNHNTTTIGGLPPLKGD